MTSDLWNAVLGGMLIGAGSAMLLLFNGKIAGISGILENTVSGVVGEQAWRVAFLLGLVAPALILGLGNIEFAQGLPGLALSGLLVGFGTRLGSGCTSGHGVCGISNFSPRSLLATCIFMVTAIATVAIVRHGALRWAF
jgi:uncharacterized protein